MHIVAGGKSIPVFASRIHVRDSAVKYDNFFVRLVFVEFFASDKSLARSSSDLMKKQRERDERKLTA